MIKEAMLIEAPYCSRRCGMNTVDIKIMFLDKENKYFTGTSEIISGPLKDRIFCKKPEYFSEKEWENIMISAIAIAA